jgi:DNA-directed RNA polymerase subunit RPC12/RpoP
MTKIQKVRCPNCGSHARRQYFSNHNLMETACPNCDYLLVSCRLTGKVIESYAPGISSS